MLFHSYNMIRNRDITKMQVACREFKLSQSKCFCCDANHTLADGTSISCDRRFVEQNVNSWFEEFLEEHQNNHTRSRQGASADRCLQCDSSDGVREFERLVNEELCDAILQQGDMDAGKVNELGSITCALLDLIDIMLGSSGLVQIYAALLLMLFLSYYGSYVNFQNAVWNRLLNRPARCATFKGTLSIIVLSTWTAFLDPPVAYCIANIYTHGFPHVAALLVALHYICTMLSKVIAEEETELFCTSLVCNLMPFVSALGYYAMLV